MNPQLDLLDREWCDRMTPVVLGAMQGRDFTADDLHGVVEPPANQNLYGVLMAKLRTSRLVERVGYTASNRPERNGGVVRVWRTLSPPSEPRHVELGDKENPGRPS